MVSKSTSSRFPGFANTFVLDDPGNSRAFRGDIALSVDDAFAVTRAEISVDSVEVRWSMGASAPGDIVRTTIAAPMIVSDRVVTILRVFSGWITYPVKLIGKNGSQLPGYHGLAITGRCGPIDNARAIKFDKIMPGGIYPWWRGLYFDPMTWDGTDLFMPIDRVGWIFVVERVRRALERANVGDLVFTSLDDIERMQI
jgi:hypothetical protein